MDRLREVGGAGRGPVGWLRRRRPARDLAESCEVYLAGHYAEYLAGRSELVPVWAWTNRLAHGTYDEIREAAASEGGSDAYDKAWRAARAYLAVELLDAVDSGGLADIQRDALVPLELDLAGRPDVDWWDCARWVTAVRAALEGRWSNHR